MRIRLSYFYAVLFILICMDLRSQENPDKEIRILRKNISRTGDDSSLIDLQQKMAIAYIEKGISNKSAIDSALYFLTNALDHSRRLNDSLRENQSMALLCDVYYVNGETEKGESCFMKLIEHHQLNNNSGILAKLWFKKGKILWRLYNSDNSYYAEIMQNYSTALSLYKAEGQDSSLEATLVKLAIADVHMCQGELDLAENLLLDVLDSFHALDYHKTHFAYYLLSVTTRLKGDLDKALLYSTMAAENADGIAETYSLSLYLSVVGDIYRELEEYEESIKWYERSLYEWEFNGSKGRSVEYRCIHYLAKELVILGNGVAAINRLAEFETNFPPKKLESKALMASAKASAYEAIGNYDLAEAQYQMALQYFDQLGSGAYPIYISETYQDLGNFLIRRKRFDEARLHLIKALEIPDGYTATSRRREVNLSLFEADSALGNLQSAIEYFKVYKLLNDRIFDENKSKQIEELRLQYETATKENEIASLQNDRMIQISRLEKANSTRNFTIWIAALLLIIILLLLYSYFANRKSNRLLQIKNNEIKQKNASLENLVSEKEWLLREVHHRVKNSLQIVMSLLNTQSYLLTNKAAVQTIKNSQHRLYAISLIHTRLYNAEVSDTINMKVYITDLVRYLKDSFETSEKILFNVEVEPLFMDTTKSVPLGLILNEAITNSIKYAFPEPLQQGKITISFRQFDPSFSLLQISDNGVGLPADIDTAKSASLGITLIKGLAKQINATVDIRSDNGVLIEIRITEDGYNHQINEVLSNLND